MFYNSVAGLLLKACLKLMTHLQLVPRSRMCGAIPPLPNKPSWCSAQLKHRDNFTFTFYPYITVSCSWHMKMESFLKKYRNMLSFLMHSWHLPLFAGVEAESATSLLLFH